MRIHKLFVMEPFRAVFSIYFYVSVEVHADWLLQILAVPPGFVNLQPIFSVPIYFWPITGKWVARMFIRKSYVNQRYLLLNIDECFYVRFILYSLCHSYKISVRAPELNMELKNVEVGIR